MTNFEALCKSPGMMARFLEKVQDDALEAEGCSLKLTMPPDDGEYAVDWEAWLEQECWDPDGFLV